MNIKLGDIVYIRPDRTKSAHNLLSATVGDNARGGIVYLKDFQPSIKFVVKDFSSTSAALMPLEGDYYFTNTSYVEFHHLIPAKLQTKRRTYA